MDLDPGTVVANRYRISRPLGRGGMGEVFAAENIRTGRPVAIKLLRQDSKSKSTAIARFRQEARAAGSINSDHVTQVLDVEDDPEHGVVLVFELLEGESLIDRLKRTGPIPFSELHPIIEEVWLGLADAHRVGIVHRDLKPSNVFLERRPDGVTRVKIMDFGISKVPKEVGGETLTEMGQSLGTFSFMPPEQIGKAKLVDHRADIYACTTLIYQSLTGQLPYAARNILIMVEMKSKADARSLREVMGVPVDHRVEAFVARGLARDAGKRFQSAIDALAAWRELRSVEVPAMPQAPPQRPAQPSGRSSSPPSSLFDPAVGSAASHDAGKQGAPTSSPRLRIVPGRPPESASALPRLADVADIATDETAATVAMPMQHLQKGAGASPPSQQRIELVYDTGSSVPVLKRSPATYESNASPAPVPVAPPAGAMRTGPKGTQVVTVSPSGSLEYVVEPRAEEQNLRAHPAGYYIPPQVAASIGRPPSQPHAPQPTPPVPHVFDDHSSSPEAGQEVATQLYRPREGDTSGRYPVPPQLARPPAPQPVVPLASQRGVATYLLFLFACLVIGFITVTIYVLLFQR